MTIKKLDSTNTTDIYGISTKFVKLASPVIGHILSILFNKSLKEGIFPDVLKLAKIIPIHKSGSLYEVANFRPISLLPILSKILERIIYNSV